CEFHENLAVEGRLDHVGPAKSSGGSQRAVRYRGSRSWRRAMRLFCPAWWLLGVEGDVAGSFEEHADHGSCFDAGKWCADAVVDAAAEGEVAAGHRAVEVDVVGSVVLGGVAVGGAPEQQDG
nr:hypothetical protein [Micromonospora sp. DSM 115978]